MKKFFHLFLFLLSFYTTFSQQGIIKPNRLSPNPFVMKTTTTWLSVNPDWNICTQLIFVKKTVRCDSVYVYKNKAKSKDSILAMTQYFDSLGNITERDEFNFNTHELFRISNYSYNDGLLFNEEIITRNTFKGNVSNLSKSMFTCEYDSAGNMIVQKLYFNLADSLHKPSLTIIEKEYDSLAHVTAEYETLTKGDRYLHHSYLYNYNNEIAEIKTFDQQKKWMYSYLCEYDETANTKTVFFRNTVTEKSIRSSAVYDQNKRLGKIIHYNDGVDYGPHQTESFFYNKNGLLEMQIFDNSEGHEYFFKHFYTYY